VSEPNTLKDAEYLPVPAIEVRTVSSFPPPFPEDPKLRREYVALLKMWPELVQTHAGKYVAIHEGAVVGSGTDKIQVATQAYARYGYVPVYVHLVTDQPLPLERIPSLPWREGFSVP